MERRIRFIFCVFSEDSDMGSVTLDQYYLWPMVWSRRRWSLHWGPAVTETLPSYTNPQSEGRLGWVPGLRPLVCCQQGGYWKFERECGEVFGAGWWQWWLDCSSKWIKVSGCHGHKDNVQGEKKKEVWGCDEENGSTKGEWGQGWGKEGKRLGGEMWGSLRGKGREEEGIHQNKKGRLEMKGRERAEVTRSKLMRGQLSESWRQRKIIYEHVRHIMGHRTKIQR